MIISTHRHNTHEQDYFFFFILLQNKYAICEGARRHWWKRLPGYTYQLCNVLVFSGVNLWHKEIK